MKSVSAPRFDTPASNILGEDHRFLFLSGQRNEGFEYRHISIADLIGSAVGNEFVGP